MNNDYVIKRIDRLSSDVEFCQSHWNWANPRGKFLFVIEAGNSKFSVAVCSDSRTICSEEAYSIISYKEPITVALGVSLIQYLEDENIISKYPPSQNYHRRLITSLSSQNRVNTVRCTCGAVKTYGQNALKQTFLHSDWCGIHA